MKQLNFGNIIALQITTVLLLLFVNASLEAQDDGRESDLEIDRSGSKVFVGLNASYIKPLGKFSDSYDDALGFGIDLEYEMSKQFATFASFSYIKLPSLAIVNNRDYTYFTEPISLGIKYFISNDNNSKIYAMLEAAYSISEYRIDEKYYNSVNQRDEILRTSKDDSGANIMIGGGGKFLFVDPTYWNVNAKISKSLIESDVTLFYLNIGISYQF